MAITVTTTHVYPGNKAFSTTQAEGVSETNGTAEIFELAFPASDETCYIIIKNGNVAAVQAKLLAAAANNGYYESNYTVAKNAICVIGIESAFVKDTNGKVSVKLTPNASSTVKSCGATVSGVYSGVTTH